MADIQETESYITVDRFGVVQSAGEAFFALFNADADDIKGISVSDLLGTEAADFIKLAANGHLKEERIFWSEVTLNNITKQTKISFKNESGSPDTPLSVYVIPSALPSQQERDNEELKRLRAENKNLKTVLDNIPIAVYARDAQGILVYMNRHTWKIQKQGGDEKQTGLNYPVHLDVDRINRSINNDLTLLFNNEIRETISEFGINNAPGRMFNLYMIKTPVYEDGKPQMIVTIQEETRTFFKQILDGLPVAIYAKKESGEYIIWNKKSELFFGKKAEEVIGKKHYDDSISNVQLDFLLSRDREIIQAKKEVEIPHELVSTPEGARIMRTIKVPLFNTDGSLFCLLGMSEDVTEKTKFIKQIQDISARNKLLIEKTKDGVFLFSGEEIIFANNSIVKLLGYSVEEMQGRKFIDFVEESSIDKAEQMLKSLRIANNNEIQSVINLKTKEGTTETFEVSAISYKEKDKKETAMFLRKF
ncbi:PAS domain S-box-containing protein [Parelusimicrobium proximum]|uniref:PAS domain-containing protein n=1 Tax=Parelusimicrobium proximum TaxID=3228953 RepID=UPI003D17F3B5